MFSGSMGPTGDYPDITDVWIVGTLYPSMVVL